MSERTMTIGELSRRIGTKVETIRYYEKTGLMPDPPRTVGGHRVYGRDLARRLGFIRRSRDLGFSIDQIRKLLALDDRETASCEDVLRLARAHQSEIRRKIAELQRMDAVLDDLSHSCANRESIACPILESLGAPPPPGPRADDGVVS